MKRRYLICWTWLRIITNLFKRKIKYVTDILLAACAKMPKVSAEKRAIQNVGKLDPKKHLEDGVNKLMSQNIVQALGTMLDAIVF